MASPTGISKRHSTTCPAREGGACRCGHAPRRTVSERLDVLLAELGEAEVPYLARQRRREFVLIEGGRDDG